MATSPATPALRRKRMSAITDELMAKCRKLNALASKMTKENSEFEAKLASLSHLYNSRVDESDNESITTTSSMFDLSSDEESEVEADEEPRRSTRSSTTSEIQNLKEINLKNFKTVVQCSKCRLNVRGGLNSFIDHIATHEMPRMECPVEGCAVHLPEIVIMEHVKAVHKRNASTISAAIKTSIAQHTTSLATLKLLIPTYFPAENYLGATHEIPVSPFGSTCLKCQKTVRTRAERELHITMHLQSKIKCPVVGCEKPDQHYNVVAYHMKQDHLKALGQLMETEDIPFREAQTKILNKVNKIMGQFFEIKQ